MREKKILKVTNLRRDIGVLVTQIWYKPLSLNHPRLLMLNHLVL